MVVTYSNVGARIYVNIDIIIIYNNYLGDLVMNKLQIKGNWNELKGQLKKEYANLTDDDLRYAEGKEDELLGRLQQRLGHSKEDLIKKIDSFQKS